MSATRVAVKRACIAIACLTVALQLKLFSGGASPASAVSQRPPCTTLLVLVRAPTHKSLPDYPRRNFSNFKIAAGMRSATLRRVTVGASRGSQPRRWAHYGALEALDCLPPSLASHTQVLLPSSGGDPLRPLAVCPPNQPSAAVQLSHVRGATEPTLIGQPIGAFFDAQVARYGTAEALRVVHQGVRWSWRDLQQRHRRSGAGPSRPGPGSGRPVGRVAAQHIRVGARWYTLAEVCVEELTAHTQPFQVVTQYATAKTGIVLVNINPAYRVLELECVLCSASAEYDAATQTGRVRLAADTRSTWWDARRWC